MMFIGRPSLNDPLIVVANDSLCIQTGRLRRLIEYGRIVSIERRHYSLRGSKTVLNIRLVTGEVTVWTLPDMWGQYERGIDDALFARGVRLVKYRDDKVEP